MSEKHDCSDRIFLQFDKGMKIEEWSIKYQKDFFNE